MGEFVYLYKGNYKYELPAVPKNKEDILFHEYPKKDQYWRTPQFPSPFEWKRLAKKTQYDIVTRERERWENGVWFYNAGVPVYITGMHYDHLTNMTFEFGKAKYYDSQRLDFYFRDFCLKDPYCFGMDWMKPRRYGMTAEELTQQLYMAMNNPEKICGMLSLVKKTTMETLFNPMIASFLKRPRWTRPAIYTPNGKIPKEKLIFNDGKVDVEDEDNVNSGNSRCLNSEIIPKSTTVAAYDAYKLIYLTMDEVWKWRDIDPYDCYEKQKKCFIVSTGIYGKCSILSTMGDDDSYAKAIEKGIQMWYDSDPAIRDNNGRTKSGLYRYFISAVYAQFNFADIYGFIDVKRATEWIMNERAKYPVGSKEYMYECRRMPITEEEAIATANTSAIFDYKRVQSAIEILMRTPEDQYPTFFADLNELPNGRIELEKKKFGDGEWEFAQLPKVDEEKDHSNRWYVDGSGQIYLRGNPQGCIGYDPVRFAEGDTTSNNLSNAAIIARQKFDYYGNGGANKYTALYHKRPNDSEDAHYEAYKLSKYLGFPIMFERNVPAFKTRMIDLNFANTLLKSPYDGKTGLITSKNRKVVNDGIDYLQAYWKPPQTMEELNHYDYLAMTPFLSLLKEAQIFNPVKTTIFDIIMANCMMEIGLLQIKETNLSERFNNNQNQLINILIPTRQEHTRILTYNRT